MVPSQPIQAAAKSRTIRLTWLITGILASFPLLSLWIIPWLRSKSFEIPTLSEPGTPEWIFTFVMGSIGCVVLLVGQILAFQNRKVAFSARLWAAIAVAATWGLWGYWFYATTTKAVKAGSRAHSVKLDWKASTSQVIGYNIYRTTTPGKFTDPPVNAAPVRDTTYTDASVEGNTTYYYATRAVDAKKNESAFSNIAPAAIP